jgi:hypothetical protein
MKIIVATNKKKNIFTNSKYYLPVSSAISKKYFNSNFYGEIGKYLYAVENILIDDKTIGFIKNNYYFSFLENDPENTEKYDNFSLDEYNVMAIVNQFSSIVTKNGILSAKDEMLIYIKNKIIYGLDDTDVNNIVDSFINDFEAALKDFIGDESFNILSKNKKIITSNVCILPNDVFYVYGKFLIEFLNIIQSLDSYKQIIKNKNIPNKNKKIGEFISDRMLNVLAINKSIISCSCKNN